MNIKWEEAAPTPVNHYGHTAVWLNGLVYVGGGNDVGGSSYIISCYNPVNNSWSSIDSLYGHFAMTTLNNKLVTVGGEDRSRNITSQIFTMDAGQLKNYIKMITARSYATAAGHQGMLIITGGWNARGKTSCTELFDSDNGEWYKCRDLPQPYTELKSVIVDNILYLLGGKGKDGNLSTVVFTAPLDTLSTHQLKWDFHQNTPWCTSAPLSVNGTHLLIVAGSEGATHTSEIYKLNKVGHSWESIGHIPSTRKLTAAVSTADNRIIVIGGENDKFEFTNTVWIGSCEPQ